MPPYDMPSLRRAQLDKGSFHYDRKPARNPCEVPCTLLVNGREEPVLLQDYSARGFRIGTRNMLMVGTPVTLMLPGCIPVDAAVRWSLGGMAGCRFDVPINEDLMRIAVGKAGREEGVEGQVVSRAT